MEYSDTHTPKCGHLQDSLSSVHIRSTPPASPSGMWRKFEKNIQNLLFVISKPGGAWLLSIAPFFQPFDILLDVGVCQGAAATHIVHYFRGEEG